MPQCLSRALAVVAAEARFSRRVAVLGEMLELGHKSAELHRASGEEAARSGLAVLIAIGGANARAMAEGAVHAGMPAFAVRSVEDSQAAADAAIALVQSGDLVLVKGSRSIRSEVLGRP